MNQSTTPTRRKRVVALLALLAALAVPSVAQAAQAPTASPIASAPASFSTYGASWS